MNGPNAPGRSRLGAPDRKPRQNLLENVGRCHLPGHDRRLENLGFADRPRQGLGHRVTRARSEPANGRSIFDIAIGQVESTSGFGARQVATAIASFRGSRLECPQQGATNAPKSRVRRYVVEADRSRVGYRSNRQNVLVFYSYEHRVVVLAEPGTEVLMCLVGQPSHQYGGVISVIGFTEFGDRPLQHNASSGGVFRYGVSYLHELIFG